MRSVAGRAQVHDVTGSRLRRPAAAQPEQPHEPAGGRALGRTGAMRLARAEQENRELKAEQARLLGAIRERDEKLANMQKSNGGERNIDGQTRTE